MKKIFLLVAIAVMAAVVFSVRISLAQTLPETAKKILGDKFISREEASAAWQNINQMKLVDAKGPPILFSETLLRECARKNSAGETDFYLVPIFGLGKDKLSAFWDIASPDLPLKISPASWRLINFQDDPEIFFSWKDEVDNAAERGMTIMPALDYLEAVAVVGMIRQQDKTTKFSKFYFSRESLSWTYEKDGSMGEESIIYSADLASKKALLISFPKENFLPGIIKPKEFSFVVFNPDGSNSIISLPLEGMTNERIDYDISAVEVFE